MTIEQLTTFLGWVGLLNIGMFAFMALVFINCRADLAKLHGKLFGLKEAEAYSRYFEYMARYKMVILAFNLAPYFALRIMMAG